MPYPARTIDGETVMIVDKSVQDGSASMESLVLTSEDGRQFNATPNGLRLVEIEADEAA